jgi:HK97 family phage portal protein/HK97 family phage prohead protease
MRSMGLFSRWRVVKAIADAPQRPARPKFDITPADIDPALFGLASWSTTLLIEPRISRREAIQCGAVKRSRDLIAGTIGSLPMCLYDGQHNKVEGSVTSRLLDQPEVDRPASVTFTQTVEDMLFEGVAWWRVVQTGTSGYPTRVRRLDARSVDIRGQNQAYVRSDGTPQGSVWEWVPETAMIRFESPNDPLLVAGARAIRTALRLDAAASRMAEEPMPQGYFEPAEGADPADDTEIADILDDWKISRQTRSTGYVPAALKYNVVQWSATDMQLAASRDFAVKEIARHAGVDSEDLQVSTTSRTYVNGEQRARDLINFTLRAYMSALTGRLSMGDITPRGYKAEIDLDQFLEADSKTRWEVYQIAKNLGAATVDEIRAKENEPALPEEPAMPATPPMPLAPPVQPPGSNVVPMVPMHTAGTAGYAADAAAGIASFAFDAPGSVLVDRGARTITGLAVPYNVASKLKYGRRWSFDANSLLLRDPVSKTKLLVQHDRAQAVGKVLEFTQTPDGLIVTFQVARGPAGDHALTMAEDGIWDGLSPGLGDGGTYTECSDGTLRPVGVPLAEISLTPDPAFDDARVSAVAASAY